MYRFRPLRDQDKPALYNIIHRHNDIPLRWRSKYVIENYSSGIHVVSCYNRIVGMVNIIKISDDEAWLESAYITSQHRGKGVGSAFAKYQLRKAEELNVKVLRLATGYKNKRVQHLMTNKFNFSKPLLWHRARLVNNYKKNTIPNVERITEDQIEECWSFINNNVHHTRTNGMITANQDNCWWYSLSHNKLVDIIKKNQSLAYINNGKIMGILLVDKTVGMNFNSVTVLQSYIYDNIALEQMIRYLILNKSSVFISTPSNPTTVINRMKKDGSIKNYSHNKWVLLEKRLG